MGDDLTEANGFPLDGAEDAARRVIPQTEVQRTSNARWRLGRQSSRGHDIEDAPSGAFRAAAGVGTWLDGEINGVLIFEGSRVRKIGSEEGECMG